MENIKYELFGKYVRGILNKYSSNDIEDGIDVLLEMFIELVEDDDNLDNIEYYSIEELDDDSIIYYIVDIKDRLDKYSDIEVGKYMYDIINW